MIEVGKPLVEEYEWQLRGACRGMDTDLFYLPFGTRGKTKLAREQKAKKICAGCEVLEKCRNFALRNEEEFGVWGGTTADERTVIFKQRRTAGVPPPRKHTGNIFKK